MPCTPVDDFDYLDGSTSRHRSSMQLPPTATASSWNTTAGWTTSALYAAASAVAATDGKSTLADVYDENATVVVDEEEQPWQIREKTAADVAEEIIYRVFVVVICALGLTGNLFNLVVLSRKSMTGTMERLERSAHYGLVALAVSDALFCLAVLPTAYVGQNVFDSLDYDFRFVYTVYGSGVINTFILSSTWLTVTMAVSRYVAICYPLQARRVLGRSFAFVAFAVVGAVSVVFNVPRYFRLRVENIACAEGGRLYYVDEVSSFDDVRIERAYQGVYFVVGILLPFLLLAFCNLKLILALRMSIRVREQSYAGTNQRNESAANRITLTLVVIVAMYIVLVVPCEVMTFFKEAVTVDVDSTGAYNLALAVANMFQVRAVAWFPCLGPGKQVSLRLSFF